MAVVERLGVDVVVAGDQVFRFRAAVGLQEVGKALAILDQDEEGILAFRGALAVTPIQSEEAVIWDIGGGSMQLTTLTDEGTYLVEKGKLASIPFKNAIIEMIKRQNIQSVSSPNPLSADEMQAALRLAEDAALATDPYVKRKIVNPTTQILGVGSLFNYAIKPLAGQPKVSLEALEKSIQPLIGKTDQELPGGALAEVAVSNPLLVLGYMKALQIPQITILSVNNADGALTYPPYWELPVQAKRQ